MNRQSSRGATQHPIAIPGQHSCLEKDHPPRFVVEALNKGFPQSAVQCTSLMQLTSARIYMRSSASGLAETNSGG